MPEAGEATEFPIRYRYLRCARGCNDAGVLMRRPVADILCGRCEGPLEDAGEATVLRGTLQRAKREIAHRRLRGDA